MASSYTDYLLEKLSISLFIALLSLAYINSIALYIPIPKGIEEELHRVILETKELFKSISGPLDMLMYIAKKQLQMALYIVIPLAGIIVYTWTLTITSWSIVLESIYQEKYVLMALATNMLHPLTFLELLSFSLLLIESNTLIFNLITKKDVISMLHSTFTISISLIMLIVVTVLRIISIAF